MKKEKLIELLALLKSKTSFKEFKDQNDVAYVRCFSNGKSINYKVKTKSFRIFLMSFLREHGESMSKPALELFIDEIEAICVTSNEKIVMNNRVLSNNECICIDLNDNENNIVKIMSTGYLVAKDSSIPFWASTKQQSLPIPQPISQEDFLVLVQKYINFKNPEHLILILAFMVKTLMNHLGASVILVLQGKQDTGKLDGYPVWLYRI